MADALLNPLTNLNPDYYKTIESDEDSPSPYSTRTMIYSTLDNLPISQVRPIAYPYFEPIPDNTNLTIQALHLLLAGNISIPDGDIQIYCKTLTIVGVVTVDVSAKNMEVAYFPQTEIEQAAKGTGGKSGAHLVEENGLLFYNSKGNRGGNITIICQEILWGENASLTLKANGEQGRPGHNGQRGGDATEDLPAGRGGDAQSGGEGGDGGSITIQYVNTTNLSNLTMEALGGSAGSAGIPGLGGGMSSTHFAGLEGNAAQPTLSGEAGDRSARVLIDLGEMGRACDEAFMLKVVQRAKLIYLQNQPEMYQDGGSPSEEWKKDWANLLELMIWIQSALAPYMTITKTSSLADIRKNNLYAIISKYVAQHNQMLDYFCKPYNEVPTMVIDEKDITVKQIVEKYLPQYDALITQQQSLSSNFQTMMTEYEKEKSQNILNNNYLIQLTFAQERYHESYQKAMKELIAQDDGSLSHQLEIAISRAKTCQYALATLLEGVKLATEQYRDYNIKNILESLSMFAFTGGEGAAGAAMGAIAAYQIYDRAINDITDDDGTTQVKKKVIKDLVTFKKTISLNDLRSTLFTQNANGDLELSQDGKYILASLDQLDKLIQEFTTALGSQLTKTAAEAIENYKAAIYAKGQLQLRYTSYANKAASDYQQYLNAKEEITQINSKNNHTTPYHTQLIAHCAMMYQEQIEQIVEFVSSLRREYAYLTMQIHGRENSKDIAKLIPALWGQNPASGANTDLTDLRKEIHQIIADLAKYYATRQSPAFDIPKLNSKERGALFSFSITDESVIKAFITHDPADPAEKHSLTIRIIPEGSMKKYQKKGLPKTAAPRDKTGNLLFEAPNTLAYYNIRVTKIQPRVYGASGTSPHNSNPAGVQLMITADTSKGIMNGASELFIFCHELPRTAAFIHRIDTLDPEKINRGNKEESKKVAYDDDILQNNAGYLTDNYLDALGLFGCWTINIKPGGPGSVNQGLDLKSLYKITLYFAVKAQAKANFF